MLKRVLEMLLRRTPTPDERLVKGEEIDQLQADSNHVLRKADRAVKLAAYRRVALRRW